MTSKQQETMTRRKRICGATSAELREYAELRIHFTLEAELNPDELRRLAELESAIAGEGATISEVCECLALALAEERDEFCDAIEAVRGEFPESDLLMLPSGRATSLNGLRNMSLVTEPKSWPPVGVGQKPEMRTVLHLMYENGNLMVVADPHDIAALRAHVHRIAASIESPTLAGDDRDGDGKVGE